MAIKQPGNGGSKVSNQDAAAASRGGSKPISYAAKKTANAAAIKKNNPYAAGSGRGTTHVTGSATGRKTVDRPAGRAIKNQYGNTVPLPKNALQDNRRPNLAKKMEAGRVARGKETRARQSDQDFYTKGAKKAAQTAAAKKVADKAKSIKKANKKDAATAARGGSQPLTKKAVSNARANAANTLAKDNAKVGNGMAKVRKMVKQINKKK